MRLERGERVSIAFRADGNRFAKLAAEELSLHLQHLGMEVLLVEEWSRTAKTFLLGPGWDSLADEELSRLAGDAIALRTLSPKAVLITGGNARGLLNAVYTFLEDHIGILWLNAEETSWPETKSWDFSGLAFVFSPPFRLRSVWTAASLDATWAARKRLNFFTDEAHENEPLLEGSTFFAGDHCHNVYKLLSLGFFGLREDPKNPRENRKLIEELHRLHPEYFALVGGQRRAYTNDGLSADLSDQTGNISLTNPEVDELLLRGARLLLDNHPHARAISLSLRDNYHYCEEALASPGGVQGALVRLVNRFAEKMQETHPAVLIDFLAYHGTQRPPLEGKLHPNVMVRYCPIRISQFHAFDESKHNVEGGLNFETPPSLSQPKTQIENWRKLTDNVVVWYYSLNLPFFHPQPSLRAHGENFRLMKSLGVNGVSVQDNQPIRTNCLNDLRVHLLTKLLWNPEVDEQQELKRFCHLYYGPAAPAVMDYIALMHDEGVWNWEEWPEADGQSKWSKSSHEESWMWFGDVVSPSDYPEPHFYTLYRTRPPLKQSFFIEGYELMQRALRAVRGQPLYEKRLEEVQMTFFYAVLCYPDECGFCVDEAERWFTPRFQALREEYRGVNFYGLDRMGLADPTPLPSRLSCVVS